MSELTDIERARRDAMRTAAHMRHLEAFVLTGRQRRERQQHQQQVRSVKTGPNHNFKMAGNSRTIHRAGPLGR